MSLTIDRSLRLPDSQYFPSAGLKTGIAIHHTVGRDARSTVHWWMRDRANGARRRMVATAYLIDPDGTVYEAFDPTGWAYQFGLEWSPSVRLGFERRFIGIELVSEGGLIERDGALYCFDRVSPRTRKAAEEAFDFGSTYRGYRWFDRYEPAQLTALGRLIDRLCTRFEIPRRFPSQPFEYYGDALAEFTGIIGHAMVRRDKSDPAPDRRVWSTLMRLADARPVEVRKQVSPDARVLSSHEIEALAKENARHVDALTVAAGSLVNALLMELERRRTYLRLSDPGVGGHAIRYRVLQGARGQVGRIARALGFRTGADGLLEVHDA